MKMSNNKQTFNHNPNQSSVDWLIGEILKYEMTFFGTASIPLRIIEQAKAMHKEELEFAFKGGMSLVEGHLWKPIDKFEEFYNAKFGGNK